MPMLAWNARGLGNKDTVRALKNLCFKYKNDIVFLSETKQKKSYLEKIRMRVKMDNAYVEPIGIADTTRNFYYCDKFNFDKIIFVTISSFIVTK
ncbi:hypothetical protein GQ457_05G028990 [Hibiscus cannabinus]